jgi:hypothetical protein
MIALQIYMEGARSTTVNIEDETLPDVVQALANGGIVKIADADEPERSVFINSLRVIWFEAVPFGVIDMDELEAEDDYYSRAIDHAADELDDIPF